MAMNKIRKNGTMPRIGNSGIELGPGELVKAGEELEVGEVEVASGGEVGVVIGFVVAPRGSVGEGAGEGELDRLAVKVATIVALLLATFIPILSVLLDLVFPPEMVI